MNTAERSRRTRAMQQMHPDSKASRVLAILADGPATTAEIAAETGWTKHNTCAHVKNLHMRGKVERKPWHVKGQGPRFLWFLPPNA